MEQKTKKHFKIAGIIWLVIALFIVITTGVNNIISAILLGLIYVGFYFLNAKGYNPVINGLKTLWRGGPDEEEIHKKNNL